MNSLLSSVTPSQSVSTNSVMTQQYQANSFIPEKDEIWSGILKGVASSKMVPTKNVLILGDPGVGKSTLVHYLKNDPGPQQLPLFEKEDPAPFSVSSTNNHHYTHTSTEEEKNNLALGYSFVDVKDEENEAMARLGLYQLGLSSPEFLPLLKFALRSETITDSCVLILLDWTRPWTFLETLERWINVLHYVLKEICEEGKANTDIAWSKGRAIVDELREKLERYLQTYTEPSTSTSLNGLTITASTSTSSIPSTTASAHLINNNIQLSNSTTLDQVVLPLSSGCLTNNLGIPITIVCCKSDALNSLEQTHDYKDDQFDYIQQTLRCICMKYGAALLYTSTLHPYTFHSLREYILHRVLNTPSKPYSFHLKAQVIERDTVLVPSGWDSWGKIRILREGFDCDHVSEGWDADMDAVIDRQNPGNTGARGTYEESITNQELEIQPQFTPVTTICEDEQSFYDRHYEKLQKTQDNSSRNGTGAAHSDLQTRRPGVVGPLDVTSAALHMMRASGNTTNNSPVTENGRKKDLTLEKLLMKGINGNSSSKSTNGHMSPLTASPGGLNSNIINNTPSSATAAAAVAAAASSSTNNGAGQNAPSHEVLANFFQSLLKTSSNNGAGSPTTSGPVSPGGQPNGRSSHKDLDVMRQYTVSK